MSTRDSCSDGLTVFYDGACAVCAFEIDALRARAPAGRLHWVDISSASFDASAHGFAHAELDAAMHVVDGSGRIARGIDALAALYRAAGCGAVCLPLAVPGVRLVAGVCYRAFARHRSRISRTLGPLLARLRHPRERSARPCDGARP